MYYYAVQADMLSQTSTCVTNLNIHSSVKNMSTRLAHKIALLLHKASINWYALERREVVESMHTQNYDHFFFQL